METKCKRHCDSRVQSPSARVYMHYGWCLAYLRFLIAVCSMEGRVTTQALFFLSRVLSVTCMFPLCLQTFSEYCNYPLHGVPNPTLNTIYHSHPSTLSTKLSFQTSTTITPLTVVPYHSTHSSIVSLYTGYHSDHCTRCNIVTVYTVYRSYPLQGYHIYSLQRVT